MKPNANGMARQNGELLDLPMPQDRVAEMHVVGGIILRPYLMDGCGLYDSHFHFEPACFVFRELRAMKREGATICLKALVERLKSHEDYDPGFLSDCIDHNEASPSRFGEYIARLKSMARGRRTEEALLTALKASKGGQAPDSLIQDLVDQLAVLADESAGAEKFSVRRMTSAEFDQGDYAVTYLVENILADGQPLVIAAQLKTMKSSVAVALGVALAAGQKFLGRFWVREPVNVLLLNGESGLGTMQETARRVAASHGLALSDLDRLFWSSDLPRLGDLQQLQALREVLIRDNIKALVRDPLYFMLPGQDAGNLMLVGGYLRPLSALCEELGVTLVVVHHIKKTIDSRNAPPELSQISWAGTAEWARQWILLSRREDYVAGTGRHALWLVAGGSAGHSGLYALDITEGVGAGRGWSVAVTEPDDVREAKAREADDRREQQRQENVTRARKRLIDAAAKYPNGETAGALRAAAGLSGGQAREALAQALQLGELVTTTITKNKRPEDAYKLPQDE